MTANTKGPKRKKKPPPAKKEPETNQFGSTTQVSTVEIVPVSLEESEGNEWLRRLAEVSYVTSQKAITVNTLWDRYPYKNKVSFRTMQDWCREDGWVEQREQYYRGLEEQIKRKMASAQVQSSMRLLKYLDSMFGNIIKKLDENEVEPGTYEGMVGAALKVSKTIDEIRSKVSSELVPDRTASPEDMSKNVIPVLTEDEARKAALAVIQSRMSQNTETTDDG